MPEFIFVNPSPNMEVAAKAVASMGRTVERVYTKDFTPVSPKNLWAFIGGNVVKIEEKKPAAEADANVCVMKKPFFTKRFTNLVKNKLNEINPLVAPVTFTDYILLSSSLWRDADIPAETGKVTFDELLSKYPASKIITSKVPAPNGRYFCTRWRTDYDVLDALGDDYFFYFDGRMVHELYRMGEDLVSISENKNSLDWLKRLNPTFNRFSFEKVSSVSYHQNMNPWLYKYTSKIIMLNDYTWQTVSA